MAGHGDQVFVPKPAKLREMTHDMARNAVAQYHSEPVVTPGQVRPEKRKPPVAGKSGTRTGRPSATCSYTTARSEQYRCRLK